MAEEPKHTAQPPEPAVTSEAHHGLDVAGQSLGNALRLSFRIVTVVMLVLFGFYAFSGVFTVEPGERTLVLRLGRASPSRVMKQGMHLALPYPFDQKVSIFVKPRTLEVNTFWPKVTDKEREEKIEGKGDENLAYAEGALGAKLLTGDLNILESQWAVTYNVIEDGQELVKYYNTIGVADGIVHSDAQRYAKERELVRLVIEASVVRHMSSLPVLDAYFSKVPLTNPVKRMANKMLDDLDCGLNISQVTLRNLTPPKPVRPAFDIRLSAVQMEDNLKKEAEAYASRELVSAAGEGGVKLGKAIQEWWEARAALQAAEMELADKGGQDSQLQKKIAERKTAFAKLDEKVSELFTQATGEVTNVLNSARAYETAIIEETKADVDYLRKLEERYKKSPESVALLLNNVHIEALRKVLLSSEETFVLRSDAAEGKETLEVWMDRHPDLIKRRDTIKKTR